MYGEPSVLEYGEAFNKANKAISTNGFKCVHNNTGWLGFYITTPKGAKYQLVKSAIYKDRYYLCEYTAKPFTTGKNLGLDFKDLEECKKYLILKEDNYEL